MKKEMYFDVNLAPSLSDGLHGGLLAYATDVPRFGPPSTLWLQLCDGRTVRVRVEMHDLCDWEEIGTLIFEVVRAEDSPEMRELPVQWSDIRAIEKLVYDSDECVAECGLALCTTSGEALIVVPGADVYTLAIEAPFHRQLFSPENDLTTYLHKKF